MLLGGAAVNALAFSGSNYLFSMLRSSGVDEERRRHDKAVEQLQAAHEQWSKQRTERLDWINEELRRQGHAVQTFHDVDMAIREYARVTGHNLDNTFGVMGSEPQITDFYTPSGDQKNREIAFVVVGLRQPPQDSWSSGPHNDRYCTKVPRALARWWKDHGEVCAQSVGRPD